MWYSLINISSVLKDQSLCILAESGQVELGEQGPANHHSSGGAIHGEAAKILRQ